MTHRERFFAVLEGKRPSAMPFMPDISDWYVGIRTPPGTARKHGCAKFIPDDDPFHQLPCEQPAELEGLTMLDIYKKYNWGYPVHIGGWYQEKYDEGVSLKTVVEGNKRISTLTTPKGTLQSVAKMAYDSSWAPIEHFCKQPRDLEIIKVALAATHYEPRYEVVQRVMGQMGEQGLGDMVIWRSPFGKLVQSYLGLEGAVYALADDPQYLEDFMEIQEAKDLEVVRLAAEAPERLIIISDHADENLIAPPYYRQYCIPYYRKACDILHAGGKFVSTHLDGNFKGFFPMLGETGFDLLDGCTPGPVGNYEVEELAEAVPEGMYAYCGVPAPMFCEQMDNEAIFTFADRIMDAFAGRGILNVGDILPANGDMMQVIALGEHVAERNARTGAG